MGAGKLTLAGGADGLVDAEFIYNVAAWQPMIDYVVSGERGELWIEQPEVKSLGLESYRYEWDLRLNDEVLLDLNVALGAGESKIDASTLSLTHLDLKMGAGGVEVDLAGAHEQDVDVTVRGGVGEVTILLPDNIGVKAEISGGLGEVNVSGLTKDGDVYVNDAYGKSDVTITLDVEGGVGEITLQVADRA
jgi:predicted membrane protein